MNGYRECGKLVVAFNTRYIYIIIIINIAILSSLPNKSYPHILFTPLPYL